MYNILRRPPRIRENRFSGRNVFFSPSIEQDGWLRVARLMAILIVASFCPGNFGILILETKIEKCVSFLLYRMRQIGSIRRVPEAYGYLIVASFCPGNFGILILEIMIFFLEILSFASLSIKSLCLFNCLEF